MAKVLVVRHGDGRGRIERYMEGALKALRKHPAAGDSLSLHHTGDGRPRLDDVQAVVFWLADPLKEWYPDCYEEATEIAEDARLRGISLVNPPESLSNSIKSRESKLWLEAGFETPRWMRFEDSCQLKELVKEIGFPAVIRSDESHSQLGMRCIRSAAELESVNLSGEWLPECVAPLVDLRHPKLKGESRSIYSRLHHKKRLYVLGNRVRTEHIFFSKHPFVSATSCTFARFHRLPKALHWSSRLRKGDRDTLREDINYWQRNEEHTELMVQAAKTLGFGFAAIDYSERADGSVMLWEANPHPYLPPIQQLRLPRQRHTPQRLQSIYRVLVEFLMELAGPPQDARAY